MYKKEKKKKNTTGNKLVRNVSAVFLVASIHTQTHVHRHTHTVMWLTGFQVLKQSKEVQHFSTAIVKTSVDSVAPTRQRPPSSRTWSRHLEIQEHGLDVGMSQKVKRDMSFFTLEIVVWQIIPTQAPLNDFFRSFQQHHMVFISRWSLLTCHNSRDQQLSWFQQQHF